MKVSYRNYVPVYLQQMEPELSDFAVLDIFDTSQFLENEKVRLAIYTYWSKQFWNIFTKLWDKRKYS